MNTIYKLLSKHLWVGLGLLCAVFVGTFFVAAAQPATAANPDEKLVSIYDNNSDKSVQTIATSATTVREALARAKVTITGQDSIEPGLDTQLTSGSYSVNIYRARPVTIVDGANRVHTVSPFQSPVQITAAAHITTYPEDVMQTAQISDIASDNALGLKITIKRATVFGLNLYGNQLVARSQATTVGGMLKDKGVILGKDDGVSLPLSTPIVANMSVRVWRNGVQTITQNEPIPFTTRKIQAPDQPVGYHQVQTAGANGAQSVTYQINMQNGIEVGRNKIQAVVTQPVVEQVEVIGTKRPAPLGNITAQKAQYMAAAGIASSDYGYVDYIINRESHWNVGARNSGGCLGLGQACPGSKLVIACPNWDSDPACQLRFFSAYASGKGGWEASYNIWIAKGWW